MERLEELIEERIHTVGRITFREFMELALYHPELGYYSQARERIGLAYKELWRVEYAFRELKTGLEMRPLRHWTPSRVRGHFGICFLALVMEATLARLLKETRPQTRYGDENRLIAS